jgi:hypothetical protein
VTLSSADDFALRQSCDESLRIESVEIHLLVSVELHLLVSTELRLLLFVELNKQAPVVYYWPLAEVVHIGLMRWKSTIQDIFQAMEIVEQPLLSRFLGSSISRSPIKPIPCWLMDLDTSSAVGSANFPLMYRRSVFKLWNGTFWHKN